MTMRKLSRLLAVLPAVLLLPASAGATNGYFAHGYGTHYKGLAGAGVALHLNSLAGATNPAPLVFVGKRYDLGLAVFNPNRFYSVTGNPSGFPGTFGLAPGAVESDSTVFPIPHLGANWELGCDRAARHVRLQPRAERREGDQLHGDAGLLEEHRRAERA